MTNWKYDRNHSSTRYEVEEDQDALTKSNSVRWRYRVRAAYPGAPVRPWWAGTPTKMDPNTARSETELMLSWGVGSPELFVDSIRRFQEEHPMSDWTVFRLTRNTIDALADKKE